MSPGRGCAPMASLLAVVCASTVGARDAGADVWVSAGVAETVGVPTPEHFGVYGYAGLTRPIVAADYYVIPGLGFEWCPEFDRGGAIAAVTLERAATTRV